jgi:hypothetical protein
MKPLPWLARIEVRVCLVALGVFFLAFAAIVFPGDAKDRWAVGLFSLTGISLCGTALRGDRSPRWLKRITLLAATAACCVFVIGLLSVSELE